MRISLPEDLFLAYVFLVLFFLFVFNFNCSFFAVIIVVFPQGNFKSVAYQH